MHLAPCICVTVLYPDTLLRLAFALSPIASSLHRTLHRVASFFLQLQTPCSRLIHCSRLYPDLVARLPDCLVVPTSLFIVRTSTVQPHSTDDDIIPHRSVLQHWCIDLHLRVNCSPVNPLRPSPSHRYQTVLGGVVSLTTLPTVYPTFSHFTSVFKAVGPIDVSCLNWSGQSKIDNS